VAKKGTIKIEIKGNFLKYEDFIDRIIKVIKKGTKGIPDKEN